MNKQAKVLIGILMTSLTLVGLSGCTKDKAQNNVKDKAAMSVVVAGDKVKQETPDKTKVEISEKVIAHESEYLKTSIKVPVLIGLKDKAIETKINTMFENDVLKFKASIEGNAKSDFEYSKKDKEIVFRKHEANTTFTARYNKGNILSITVLYSQYTGGAHGGANQVGYNIDLNTGNLILLPDIFDKNFNYKEVVSNEMIKNIVENKEIYFDDAEKVVKDLDKDRAYYIEEGNIVVCFGEYEIAPYSSGRPEFKIPFSKLELNPNLGIN